MRPLSIIHCPLPFAASAIVCAAGSSSRMGGKVRKPYLTLQGKPILSHTLSALAKVEGLTEIVLVTRPDDRKLAAACAKKAKLPQRVRITFADGGPRRQDSVFNGLKAADAASDLVLIHDAARPFPPQAAMAQACRAALKTGAAILALPVKDTVKRAHPLSNTNEAMIETTIPRNALWLAHTPQVFRRTLIMELFERLARETPNLEVTDDAAVCEHFGQPVQLIGSSEMNLKVTRPEDLLIAKAYLNGGRNGEGVKGRNGETAKGVKGRAPFPKPKA